MATPRVSSGDKHVPLPYRVLDKEYMAQQLPHLQEKAPIINEKPLEFVTNAPSTLPAPSLFPGEILCMQQHRVVCTNAFNEPAVGVVYLTNFRIIFNGSPISDPDMYDIIRELQLCSSSSKKGESPAHNTVNNIRTLGRKKRPPPQTAARQSKFYVGADSEVDGAEDERSSTLSHFFQRIATIRRSTEATLKTALDFSDQKKNKTKTLNESELLSISHSRSVESGLSVSAPENTQQLKLRPHSTVVNTMPRTMPGHRDNHEATPTDQSISCKTTDSGFIDPPLSIEESQPPPKLSLDDVFIQAPEDVDFERAPIDFPVKDRRRVFRKPHYRRPESLIALESDSEDSDTTSDRYFGSIAEDDDDDVLTSPELGSPPPAVNDKVNIIDKPGTHEYINVVLKESQKNTVTMTTDPTPPDMTTDAKQAPPTKPKPRLEVKEVPPIEQSSNNSPDVEQISPTKPQSSVSEKVKQAPPIKPPRKKKTCSADNITNGTDSKLESENWKQSDTKHSSLSRRPPPPPPPKKLTPPIEKKHSFEESSKYSSSESDLLRSLTPPPPKPHPSSEEVSIDRKSSSSSLIANRGSNTSYRRLTISSPRDPPYSFDWGGQNIVSQESKSMSWNVSTKITPYYQYSHSISLPLATIQSIKQVPPTLLEGSGLRVPEGILLLCKNFVALKLHLHTSNTFDALKLKELLESILSENIPIFKCFAFQYRAAIRLPNPHVLDSRKLPNFFVFDNEISRIGILDAKIENSQLWRITTITKDKPDLCPSYPEKLVVLICTPDVDLLRGSNIYREGRFPTATWINKNNGAVLLRAAATTSERGLQGSNLPVDEAILQAIRGCNINSRLFVFTEKSDATSFQDPNKLTTEAARSYYYHNCDFVYAVNPPTFKSVRHSFNKLQAMLQNQISDFEYLVELDNTRWLSRIGELLETTLKVCEALTQESAHVLVCYENGWDRTTQIVSLAQVLCDPYYRTMDGFQVLVQKEWLWFGHPFQSRHVRNNSKVKEDGPVFMQWIDCVWQVTRQCPFSFEFNENLLIAMIEHVYSNQFGTFLLNSTRERSQCFMIPEHYHQSVDRNTVSFWTWVAMINASNNIFYNPYYDSSFHPGVIYPKYYQTCLEIWRTHYDKHNVRMQLQENATMDSRLHTELHQLIKLYQERQPHLPSITQHMGLNVEVLSSSASTTVSNDETRHYGQNPLPPGRPVSRTKSEKVFDSINSFLKSEGYDSSICHHVVISTLTCQGYLVKEGGFMKNWKKRWFVLDFTTGLLTYFESEEHYTRKDSPKGVIPLDQIKRVSLSTRRLHLMSNLFQVKTPTRTYNIKAPSIISMEIWMACLKLPPLALVT